MNKRLFVILLGILFVLCAVLYIYDLRHQPKSADSKLLTAKQAVISSQTTTDGANRQYIAVRDNNIQKQKEVAENAVFEEDCMSIPDVVYDFCNLIDRAREHNDRIRQRKSGN